MNCVEVSEKMADLFDDSISPEVKNELFSHFRECEECRTLYEEMSAVVSELKPKVGIHAGRNLQQEIAGRTLSSGSPFQSRRGRILPGMSPVWKRVTAVAAVMALIFVLFPIFHNRSGAGSDAKAASTLLGSSIRALWDVTSVYMEYDVRTQEGDNFEYINMSGDFVSHKLWSAFGDPNHAEPGRWRIEKKGRTVVMDGVNQYMYCDQIGVALKSGPGAGYVSWMKILLDPMEILRKEKRAAKGSDSKYRIEEQGNEIILTVNAKATGDFRNTYALNSSIPESNNTRIYTFDKTSKLLKSFNVYIDSAGKEIQVIRMTNIKYNEPAKNELFVITLPPEVNWVAMKDIMSDKNLGVGGITSDEAARMFFTACQKEDWDMVRKFIPGLINFVQMELAVKGQYGGLTIISIGKPFKSGHGPGEFVPYSIRCKNGYVKTFNLALRKDNPEKKWIVDGGF